MEQLLLLAVVEIAKLLRSGALVCSAPKVVGGAFVRFPRKSNRVTLWIQRRAVIRHLAQHCFRERFTSLFEYLASLMETQFPKKVRASRLQAAHYRVGSRVDLSLLASQ